MGAVVLSFGEKIKELPDVMLEIIGVMGVAQVVLSAFSLVFRWDERYEYSLGSSRANTELYNKLNILAEHPPPDLEEQYNKVVEYEEREFKDLGQKITERERRFAYRETLKCYGKSCPVCKENPLNCRAGKCENCGRLSVFGG